MTTPSPFPPARGSIALLAAALVVALACAGAPRTSGPRGLPVDGTERIRQYARKLAERFTREFTVPASVNRAELPALAMRLRITRISEQGDVLAYDVAARSGDAGFDAAGVALVRRFSSAEGGGLSLPWPDATTLAYVNEHGILVDLQGRLFADPVGPAGPSTTMPSR